MKYFGTEFEAVQVEASGEREAQNIDTPNSKESVQSRPYPYCEIIVFL